MKPYLPILIAALLCAHHARAATPLTLDEALSIAQKKHPQLAEARENVAGAQARAGQASAAYYPLVSMEGDWSKGRSFLTPLERTKAVEVGSATLQLRQTIYDFGRTSGSVAAARGYRDATEQGMSQLRLDLATRVKVAFYQLLAAGRQVVAVRDAVAARQAVHLQALEYFNLGVRAKVDVARAEANLFEEKTELIRAENRLELARVELANALGLAAPGDLAPVEPAPVTAVLAPREDAYAEALGNRPEMKQLASLSGATAAQLKGAQSEHLPQVIGFANYGYADRDLPPGGRVWGVGLNLTVPIFSGFASVEKVREAVANRGAIAARQETMRLQIAREVDAARLGVKEAAARMLSTEKQSTAAEENRALAEGRYQEGVGSIIEVTDAQSLALTARTACIQARYDYYTALALMDRSMGRP
jgi:outer membrane protein